MKKILLTIFIFGFMILSGCNKNIQKNTPNVNTKSIEINNILQNIAGYNFIDTKINKIFDYQESDYLIANINTFHGSGSFSSGQNIYSGITIVALNTPFNIGSNSGGRLILKSNGLTPIEDSMSYFNPKQLADFMKNAVNTTESKYPGFYLNNINDMGTGFFFGMADSVDSGMYVLGVNTGNNNWNVYKVSHEDGSFIELKKHRPFVPDRVYDLCNSKGC